MGMINTLVSEENLSPEQKKEYNYKLFAFYNSMIAPLQMLENLAANRNMENAKLYELKIKPFPAKFAVAAGIVGLILGCWVDDWEIGKRLGFAFEVIIGLSPITLPVVGGLVAYFLNKYFMDKKIAEQEEAVRQAEVRLQNEINQLSPKLSCIPPDYCSSEAMRFFVHEYQYGKVSNQREAMLAYDQYAHRMNMENQQRMILQRQQQMMWQNEQIIANQAAARREMSYDTAMVMLSQFLR